MGFLEQLVADAVNAVLPPGNAPAGGASAPCKKDNDPQLQVKVYYLGTGKKKKFVKAKIVASALSKETSEKTGVADFSYVAVGKYDIKIDGILTAHKCIWKGIDQTKSVTLAKGDKKVVEFEIEPLIRVYIQPQFTDPEAKERPFPEAFEFKVTFGAPGGAKTVKLDATGLASDQGTAYIEVPILSDTFTLNFTQDKGRSVVCEKRNAAQKQELVEGVDPTTAPLQGKLKAESRFFRLPMGDWTLKNSKWNLDVAALKKVTYDKATQKFKGMNHLEAEVGSAAAPFKITLQPYWQYMRFAYYDRKLKGADQLSVPSTPNGDVLPICVEGWRDKSTESSKVPDAMSLWYLGDEDVAVQCLPWIVDTDPEKLWPGKKSLLRWKKAESFPFIETTDATHRKLIDLADAAKRDKPSLDRLALYDLPKIWKSQGYFGWISDTAGEFGPYEDIATKTTTKDKPIRFSLDDMVLTAADLSPIATTNATRIALLAHTFATSGAAPANIGPAAAPAAGKPQSPTPAARRWLDFQGLYNPDKAAHKSFFSNVKLEVNYIADYPHWTRLVAVEGNLFDVFDQRTPDHGTRVVGARAAVRWVDVVSGNPANGVAARPARTDKNFFSVQPYVDQEFPQRFAQIPYNHAAPTACSLGRFDQALLRCCDIDGTDEKAVALVYFRLNFVFPAPSAAVIASYVAPATAPSFASPKNDIYAEDFVGNVGKRWNGADGVAPAARGVLLPQAPPAKPFKAEVVWFGQSLPLAQSQFKCDVIIPSATDSPRSWFNGTNGTGELSPTGNQDTGQWFVGAHECGHGLSLNDDYCERWNAQSYGQLSYRWHLPGDPFEPDGRIVEFGEPGASMMNSNQEVRNRYFWHIAEWVRAATTVAMKVKIGTFDDYKVPAHATAKRNYAFWPFQAASDYQPDAANNRGKTTLLLYCLGKEKYTDDGGGFADGILVVTINIACTFPTTLVGASLEDDRQRLLQDMAEKVRSSLNGKWRATGTVSGNVFAKCRIHFSPRFVVINHDTAAAAAATLAGNMKSQFLLESDYVAAPAVPQSRWDPTRPVPAAMMSQASYQTGTGVGVGGAAAGARNPADPALDAIDADLTAYLALHVAKVPQRITAAKAIVDKTNAWLTAVMPAATPANVAAARATRKPTVQALNAQATAWHTYLEAVKTSNSVKLEGANFAAIKTAFGVHFPSMLGIFKPINEVVAADLTSLVRQVIPGGAVAPY